MKRNESIGDEKTMGDNPSGQAYALSVGEMLGQYKILRLLGRGGMGEVYEVEHTTLGRRYALKLLPADFAARPGALDRFRREAKVMANLEHPNIIRVDEFGETDGRYWLRMELAEGVDSSKLQVPCSKLGKVVSLQDLADAMGGPSAGSGQGKVPQELLLAILKQILAGLEYAHSHGAIHRDLKPSNILLSSPITNSQSPITKSLIARISDFGLVRLVGEEWVRSQAQISVQESLSVGEEKTLRDTAEGTSTRSLLGTYEYMSPEQKRGEEATAQSDIYSLGLMTFKLLTGRNPGLKPPSQIDQALFRAWDGFTMALMEEDVKGRPATDREVLNLLETVEQESQRKDAKREEETQRAAQRKAREERQRKVAEQQEKAQRTDQRKGREESQRKVAEQQEKAQREERQRKEREERKQRDAEGNGRLSDVEEQKREQRLTAALRPVMLQQGARQPRRHISVLPWVFLLFLLLFGLYVFSERGVLIPHRDGGRDATERSQPIPVQPKPTTRSSVVAEAPSRAEPKSQPAASTEPDGTRRADVVVVVNGKEITRSEVDEAAMKMIGSARRRMPPAEVDKYTARFRQQAVDNLVTKAVLADAADKASTVITDQEVDSATEAFKKALPSGTSFEQALAGGGMTESEFRKTAMLDLRVNKLLQTKSEGVPLPTEAEVRQAYEMNPEQSATPETVTARHILIASDAQDTHAKREAKKAKAEDVRAQLVKGGDFALLAQQYSDCPSKSRGGDLGKFGRGVMVKSFEDAAFSQKIGEIGPVVETQFGFHIVQVTAHEEKGRPSFEELKESLRQTLWKQKQQAAVTAYVKELKSWATIQYLDSSLKPQEQHVNTESSQLAMTGSKGKLADMLGRMEKLKGQDDLLAARDVGISILGMSPDAQMRASVEDMLGKINAELITSPRAAPEKAEYVVQAGDTLASIAQRFGTTTDLVKKANRLSDSVVRLGDRLRIVSVPFEIEVSISRCDMVLLMDGWFFKRYPIALNLSMVPVGAYAVGDKIVDPVWWKGGRAIPASDKSSALGTRWISLSEVGGAKSKGYGIHGTWQPERIGKESSSAGCISMRNADVEELFMFVPTGTRVSIAE